MRRSLPLFLLLAPLHVLGRDPLRFALRLVARLASLAAFGAVLTIPALRDLGRGGVVQALAEACLCGVVAAGAGWLRRRV